MGNEGNKLGNMAFGTIIIIKKKANSTHLHTLTQHSHSLTHMHGANKNDNNTRFSLRCESLSQRIVRIEVLRMTVDRQLT